MRKMTTDIRIRMVKIMLGRSIYLEVTVNGEAVKCSRKYANDWENGWFYVDHGERIYVTDNYVFEDLANFYKRSAKILDMISSNVEEISEEQEAKNGRKN